MTRHPTLPSAPFGHRPDSLIPRSALSSPHHSYPPRPTVPSHADLSICPLSILFLSFYRSICAARSLSVAAALSNSRCNIQRLLAVVCGGGSGHRYQKKSPTWPEPPDRQIGAAVHQPLRLVSPPLSLFSSCLLSLSRNLSVSLSRVAPLRPPSLIPVMFLLFISFCTLSLPPTIMHWTSSIGHRSVGAILE